MKAVIAVNNPGLERYILSTHQDILVLAQEKDYPTLKRTIKLHKPQLLIISETILGGLPIPVCCSEIHGLSPETRILWLFFDRKPSKEEEEMLKKQGHMIIQGPLENHELSRALYDIIGAAIRTDKPAVIAVWSPKSGDGATLTTEALTNMMFSQKEKGGLTGGSDFNMGVLDFNLKAPYLKLRYGCDDSTVIDDLIPYVAGSILNAEILGEYSKKIREGLHFIGGVRRPELYDKYNATHFNKLLEASKEYFTQVFVDAGSTLDNAGTVTGLKNADVILAIMQPNYISKYALKESLRLFPAYGINPNKVKLVLNRYVPDVFDTAEIIGAGLNLFIAGTLPELGPEASIISKNSIFEDKGKKRVAAYNQALLEICKEAGLCLESDNDKAKKKGISKLLPRRLAK